MVGEQQAIEGWGLRRQLLILLCLSMLQSGIEGDRHHRTQRLQDL